MEKIRKLTTGQGKNYTTGCLLDNQQIKNYRLIVADLNRPKNQMLIQKRLNK